MKKTHKNILGLTGLGVVAVVTAFAASLPAPLASAVASVTDTLQVRVVPGGPELTATSDSGSTITSPNYNIKVTYDNLSSIKVTLTNRDSSGNIVNETVPWEDNDLNWQSGEKTLNLNLDEWGGKGYYTVTVSGLGWDDVPVEQILTVNYKTGSGNEDGGETDADPDTGDADVEVEVPTVKVISVAVTVYDKDGKPVMGPININNPSEAEEIDFSSLPDGTYTVEVASRDQDNNIVDIKTWTLVIDRGSGGEVEVEIKDEGETITKIVVTITDEDGNVVKTPVEIASPTPGTKIDVDVSGLNPGRYTVTLDYYSNDDKIDTESYPVIIAGPDGKATIDIDTEIEVVTTIETAVYDDKGNLVRTVVTDIETGEGKIYDADGNLLFTINNGYKDGNVVIPMMGLEDGDYTGVIAFKTKSGKIVGDTITVKIRWYHGKAIVVPDTGSFFQGLNISREDYLITGLVVFMVLGVVAFGVVARNRRSSKTANRKSRR